MPSEVNANWANLPVPVVTLLVVVTVDPKGIGAAFALRFLLMVALLAACCV